MFDSNLFDHRIIQDDWVIAFGSKARSSQGGMGLKHNPCEENIIHNVLIVIPFMPIYIDTDTTDTANTDTIDTILQYKAILEILYCYNFIVQVQVTTATNE